MNVLHQNETSLRKIIVFRIFIVSLILIFGAIVYFVGDNRKEAFSLIVILSVFYLFNLLFLLFETLFKYAVKLIKKNKASFLASLNYS